MIAMKVNGKGNRSSQLAYAIAAAIALTASMSPKVVAAKASSDAIIGTGVDAIIGTGRGAKRNDAIIGTGADAIIGTGADAIIGTGADAIIGTGRAKASADAIIGTGRTIALVVGPVDSVNLRTSTVDVLGRSFRAPNAARLDAAIKGGQQVAVAIFGSLSSKGVIEKATLRVLTPDYVAGSSKVIISGRITRIDPSTATIYIGKIVVDTSMLATSKSLEVGAAVRVIGTQPVRGGIILAEKLSQ
jgi:hypothetical protein